MTQDEAFEIMKMGHNVFLTGPAGSGKTHLLNKYIKYLKENEVHVGVTASTGIASTHINGRTIHSWAGIRIAENMTPAEVKAVANNDRIADRIGYTKTLI